MHFREISSHGHVHAFEELKTISHNFFGSYIYLCNMLCNLNSRPAFLVHVACTEVEGETRSLITGVA